MVTKAKPKKAKPAVKKARPVDDALQQYKVTVESRYKVAKAIYDAQDSLTQEVLDRIRDRLRIASTGVIKVNGKPHLLDQEYTDFNLMFLATEILSDLYMFNIQVGNFVPDPAICIQCKKQLFKTGTEPKIRKKK